MDNSLKNKMFNVVPSPVDERDYLLSTDVITASVELQEGQEFWAGGKDAYVIRDQKNTNMCGAFTLSSMQQKYHFEQTNENREFSKAFLYGNRFDAREYTGEGVYAREIIKDAKDSGICFMEDFPLVGTTQECIDGFLALDESVKTYAKQHRLETYYRLDNLNKQSLVDTLVTFNKPLMFAMLIYPSIASSYDDGIMGNILPDEELIGGHMVIAVGLKKINGIMYWIIQNSWGTQYGDNGFFYMPVDSSWMFEAWLPMPYVKKEIVFTVNSNIYTVNGEKIVMDTAPVIVNDRTYLPVRFLANSLNALDVQWSQEAQTARIYINNGILFFGVDSEGFGWLFGDEGGHIPFETDSSRVGLTKSFVDENNRIQIPLRTPTEFLGLSVGWNEETREITIKNF